MVRVSGMSTVRVNVWVRVRVRVSNSAVTLMFRVYFCVLWLVSNVSKFIFNNTTENNRGLHS